MIKLGIIGWRGIVGNVFINRIKFTNIYKNCKLFLFSTNKFLNKNIFFAFNINLLFDMNIIVCCQGSNYTKKILILLKLKNWKGYWVDASSCLRMKNYNNLILDPLNKKELLFSLKKNKIYSGSNCTVSLCLLSLINLFKLNLIDWVISSSYQAISGAGFFLIKKIINEISYLKNKNYNFLKFEKDNKINFKNIPILFNAIPWIDKKVSFGQTKEEWKSQSEASKILKKKVYIDSNCVRISSLRCHSQFFLIKLKKNISLNNFYNILNNNFIKIVKNNDFFTKKILNPFYICGKLKIFLGRIRKNSINKKIFNVFSIGDQLLWGAAEPLKRFLEIIFDFLL
ncbi:aspartate-semialdehyde dehydrogenase [Candidatus Carsonella ruddii CS isolate Thao2000]|uniref:aspartate-semialdehyde dehydrogenase n=1 Tax=Candidatus Carsonella ruddii CS isolate Thao2000 TaxID=1202537 RepID=J7GSM5_CARRU|nr:aspartate-semialdehyde dehydrogenase [Candidatus Carsonella ruddii]AFP83757.1 aspartate-semialdehyde dehydrogenase [Candidatus Carsonella ruddii CS isolate Thao2000]